MMSQTQTAVKERRSARRRGPKPTTKITCYKGSLGLGRNVAVSILDISETGVRLVVKSAFERNQEIEVGILSQHQNRPVKILANVVWCIPAADGNFCVGASFQRSLNYSDFLAFTKMG
jgi:hypothetical protein